MEMNCLEPNVMDGFAAFYVCRLLCAVCMACGGRFVWMKRTKGGKEDRVFYWLATQFLPFGQTDWNYFSGGSFYESLFNFHLKVTGFGIVASRNFIVMKRFYGYTDCSNWGKRIYFYERHRNELRKRFWNKLGKYGIWWNAVGNIVQVCRSFTINGFFFHPSNDINFNCMRCSRHGMWWL